MGGAPYACERSEAFDRYGGYPFIVPITLTGAPDGSGLTLQRRAGGRWKIVARVDAVLAARTRRRR